MSTSLDHKNEVLYKYLEAEFVNFPEEEVGAPCSKHRESIDSMCYESHAAPSPEVPAYVSNCPEYLAKLISPHGRGTVDVDAIDVDNMEAIRRTGQTMPVTTVSLQAIEGQTSTNGMSKRRKTDFENIAPSAVDEGWGSDSYSQPFQTIQATHPSTKARKPPYLEAEAYAREQCHVVYPDSTSPPTVSCGIGGCSAMVSHGDTAAAVCHWRDHHPDKSNDTPIQCTWAVDDKTCTVQKKYSDLERHWVEEHFGVRWKCPVEGLQCRTHRSIKRRDQLNIFRKAHADQAAKKRRKEKAKARGCCWQGAASLDISS